MPPSDSPCVRTCCLDPNDVCIGCGRTLDEITGWRDKSALEREAILDSAKTRLTVLREHPPSSVRAKPLSP